MVYKFDNVCFLGKYHEKGKKNSGTQVSIRTTKNDMVTVPIFLR